MIARVYRRDLKRWKREGQDELFQWALKRSFREEDPSTLRFFVFKGSFYRPIPFKISFTAASNCLSLSSA